MGRVKRCIKCDEALVCKKCGARQSKEAPDWTRLDLQLTKEQKKLLEFQAKEAGLSVSEYIRRMLENEENTDHT